MATPIPHRLRLHVMPKPTAAAEKQQSVDGKASSITHLLRTAATRLGRQRTLSYLFDDTTSWINY